MWLDVTSVIALLAIGIMFITQSQYGNKELTINFTRMVGISLLVGMLLHVGATFVSKLYKLFTVIVGLILLFSAGLLLLSSALANQ